MGYQDLKLLKRPKGTTHARIVTDQGKKAKCPIKDFEVFEGVEGEVTFLKEERKGSVRKYKELGKMHFDGVWPIRVDEEETVGN
jgi:hypothetical protein|tara:strand:- start:277 stop:528 length:252 start_codon:yes stop_codon:yes gene_type:complete